ncbi:MAG TPA: TIM44-like domain-containing protein, partial [Tepidisphaeraceae bacterium]|nr:TIM44-like domain-containing protein [Tepidisphaeraceae bacterium]
ANFVVHNKGGCFPAGTMVDTPRGRVRIEQLRVGDAVITGSVSSAAKSGSSEYLRTRRGGIVERSETTFGQSSVRATFSTRSSLLVLVTEAGELRVTPEHPLALVSREFRAAEEIAIGESLLVRQGDQLRATQLLSRRQEAQPVTVYNLEVDDPHTFIADGFVVHNKGGFSGGHSSSHSYGGSSRYYGSSRSSTRPTSGPARVMWWFWDECGFFGCLVGGIFAINAVLSLFKRKSHGDEDLDFVYSPAAVAAKAMKTRQLLATLAATDPSMDPGKLVQLARDTFVKLQQCWESREYGPMQPLMMPDLYRQHVEQLDGMKRNHEINRIDNLQVDAIDVVNVRYTYKENTREFTALISARARDFYVDDRNNHFLRGDAQPARFQEFWTFHRQDGQWLLREVEQSRESDVLKDENFVEQFTDTHLKQVYATAASPGGPAGPWLEKQVETKATKTERLLNFLVQTDKLWNRDAMLTRARDVFVAVMLAQESNDPTSVPADDMFPHAADDLRRVIAQRRMNGGRIEYRNLCVRKVELILVRNFADNSKDEFVTRISAHAQTIITQNGRTTRADEYVTPFMQYWTFGRLDEQWKLKEVLAEMAGKAATTAENVDEDSSAEQMQWYYSKTRAN